MCQTHVDKTAVYVLFTLSETGMLCTGPPDNTFLKGTIEFSKTNGIPVEIMEKKDIETKYPKMTFPEDYMFVLDQCAGVLLADKALYAFQVILSIKIKFISSVQLDKKHNNNNNNKNKTTK